MRERAGRVELILVDSDGVLTDGRIYMSSDGSEFRAFDVTDGHGIRMGQQAGLEFGIISGRTSEVLARRASELDIEELHQRVIDKLERFREIIERRQLAEESICFVGDDLIDLPVMRRVGLAVAPANARPEVLESAHYVTERAGGRGALREVIDLVLRATGKWDTVARRYYV